MIILHWNPNLFHDHLALDNSRERPCGNKVVVFVEEIKPLPSELFRQGAVRIVNPERPRLPVILMSPRGGAHHLSELVYVLRGPCRRVECGHAASFADEAHQTLNDLRVGEDRPLDVVEIHRIVLLDFRIFEIVQIVAEHRCKGSGILRHELQRQVGERDRAVVKAPIDVQVHHQELSRLLRLRESLPRNRGVDPLLLFGGYFFRRRNRRHARKLVHTVIDSQRNGFVVSRHGVGEFGNRICRASRVQRQEQRLDLGSRGRTVLSRRGRPIRRSFRRL